MELLLEIKALKNNQKKVSNEAAAKTSGKWNPKKQYHFSPKLIPARFKPHPDSSST